METKGSNCVGILQSSERTLSNVLGTGEGLGETNNEVHAKYDLYKLLNWLLDILNIVSFSFLSKRPEIS